MAKLTDNYIDNCGIPQQRNLEAKTVQNSKILYKFCIYYIKLCLLLGPYKPLAQ